VLVTGGAGFIGSHLVEELARRGCGHIRVLDDLSSGQLANLTTAHQCGRVEVVNGSVLDRGLLASMLEGCTHVFHLAASVGVGAVVAHPRDCLRNNLEGFQSLFAALDLVRGSGLCDPRVVVFSSSEVYGRSLESPLREDGDLVLGPTNVLRWSYAAAKLMGEFIARTEHVTRGVDTVAVRCFNTCGPRQLPTYGMVVPRFLEQAGRGEPLTVYGDGSQTRCFSYVGDVVRDVLALAERDDVSGEVFNLGSDEEISVLALAREILRVTGSRGDVRFLPFDEVYGEGFQEVRRRRPDLSKAQRWLGERSRLSLESTLRMVLGDMVLGDMVLGDEAAPVVGLPGAKS